MVKIYGTGILNFRFRFKFNFNALRSKGALRNFILVNDS